MQEALEIAVLGLSPIIPHVTHAMWRALGHHTALIDEPWRPVDAAALQTSSIAMVVQVNGKLRDKIVLPADADSSICELSALASERIQAEIAGKTVRKVIVVPGKLVNIVVG